MEEQHIYNHNDGEPKVYVSAERNSKGWNFGASISNAASVSDAMKLLKQAVKELEKEFGDRSNEE